MLDKHYYPGKLLSGLVSVQIHLPGAPSWLPWLPFKAAYECSFCNSFSHRCVAPLQKCNQLFAAKTFLPLQTEIEQPPQTPVFSLFLLGQIKCLYGSCTNGPKSYDRVCFGMCLLLWPNPHRPAPALLSPRPSALCLPTTAETHAHKIPAWSIQVKLFVKDEIQDGIGFPPSYSEIQVANITSQHLSGSHTTSTRRPFGKTDYLHVLPLSKSALTIWQTAVQNDTPLAQLLPVWRETKKQWSCSLECLIKFVWLLSW